MDTTNKRACPYRGRLEQRRTVTRYSLQAVHLKQQYQYATSDSYIEDADAGLETFTLSDLLVKEDASQILSFMNVSADADLVALILDQLLVSFGNKITLESKTPQSSTFHFHMIVRTKRSRLFCE